jgi:hypothetical protein
MENINLSSCNHCDGVFKIDVSQLTLLCEGERSSSISSGAWLSVSQAEHVAQIKKAERPHFSLLSRARRSAVQFMFEFESKAAKRA